MTPSWLDGIQVLASARTPKDKTGLLQSVFLNPCELPKAAIRLNDAGFHLEDLSVVDTSDGFLVVYHFDHFDMPGRIALRVLVSHASPELPSISEMFPGADWHERECHDFFGITFVGHRNLIPLLLPEDAGFHPLVKEPSVRKRALEVIALGEIEQCSPDFEVLTSQQAFSLEAGVASEQGQVKAQGPEEAAGEKRTGTTQQGHEVKNCSCNDHGVSRSSPSEIDPFEMLSGDFYTRRMSPEDRDRTLILNMGPQHPSTHGVLRVIVELDGEYILKAEPVLGYLHRMHEKMAEDRTYIQYMPNMGRVDYLHAMAWNWAYVGAVERLAGIEVPERAEYIRVIVTELNRISSHLVWWGAYLLDLGAFTPILYAFEDREIILDLLQIPTGSRLTYSYFRPGGVAHDLSDEFFDGLKRFIPHMRSRLPMYRDLVTDNIILRKRLEGVGVIPLEMCRRYGATGPVVRGSGKRYDVRIAEPYSAYRNISFDIPTSQTGDCMGRYLVRMAEIEQSLSILEQAAADIPSGPHLAKGAPKVKWKAPAGEAYFAVEGARGKIGVHVLSDGSNVPYRCKLRAPGFSNMSLFAELCQGVLLADAVAILGSLDLVIPEMDR